jgi:hypothetical protein
VDEADRIMGLLTVIESGWMSSQWLRHIYEAMPRHEGSGSAAVRWKGIGAAGTGHWSMGGFVSQDGVSERGQYTHSTQIVSPESLEPAGPCLQCFLSDDIGVSVRSKLGFPIKHLHAVSTRCPSHT